RSPPPPPRRYRKGPARPQRVAAASMSERVLCSARAWVLLYDESQQQWVGAGGGPQTPSCVCLYHRPGAFRLVGRRMQPDQQVVLNCPLGRGLRYGQATPQFHQWREGRRLWGLSFAAPPEAARFAAAVLRALRALEEGTPLSWPDAETEEAEQPERQAPEEPERRVAAAGTQAAPTGGPPPPLAPRLQPRGPRLRRPPRDPPQLRGFPRLPLYRGGPVLGGGPGGVPASPPPSRGPNSGKSSRTKRGGPPLRPPRVKPPGVGVGGSRGGVDGGDERHAGPTEESHPAAKEGRRCHQQTLRRPWEKASSTLPRMKSSVPAAPPDPPGPTEEPDLERIKQELLEEVRRELQKMKEEIIEVFVQELRKRSTP
ncbi:LOW QUALITY PROTEIN: vasodilator-stimulated phosphoprotein-like, partial [Larus michahellis]|uniref:LOW QUALITY PROTEIN: vasodilator-stimulated phosphoprotein-like n=1 Tax=Larus michahellis TaxID=119627 RepID=UPI003D9BBC71